MKPHTDVAIISAYGRGNWLAAEFADSGFNVRLVDVSPHLGRWTSDDWEGPFGFFHSDDLKPLQIERLNEEDYYEPIDQGFTVWLKEGPIDLKGPLSSYYLEKYGLKEVSEKFLLATERLDSLETMSFEHSWLVYLAYSLASNKFTFNKFQISSKEKPLPIFAPYFVRRVSRRGSERSLDWCESKSVSVSSGAKIKDISFDHSGCSGIEIQSSWSGAVSADHYLWMLTSEETDHAFPEIAKALYPKGAVSAEWVWLRYRLNLGEDYLAERIPLKFVMIEDLHLPWTHDNLCLVQKSANNKDLDVWVRVPAQHRFQRSYLEELVDKIKNNFKQRIPNSNPEVVDMPQDYLYDSDELGPTRVPVYDPSSLQSLTYKSIKNFFFENPEVWSPQDWSGQFRSQQKVFDKIKSILLQKKNLKEKV